MFQVLSFDLDDTLWPVEPVIIAAERELYEWLQRCYPAVVQGHNVETMRGMCFRIAAQYPQRAHDTTFLRREALVQQFAAARHDDAPADDAMEVYLKARNRVNCYPDVRPALERLRKRYRLFAISNGNADLSRCGLADIFEGHVTAIAAGAAKPDPQIFMRMLEAAGVEASVVLHIGDDPRADIVGARRAGLGAVWLNRDARTWPKELDPPPRIVATLAELI
ncbi:MAG: HAD family hydrolase [Steroidobacteraceae bacterium]|jgi:2-haloalkanoic acid dehalogenase type II